QHRHVAARLGRPVELAEEQVPGRPVPVLDERELQPEDRRTGDAHVSVAPGADLGVPPQVLVPTLSPPTHASVPSTTTILRWLRKLSWKRLPQPRVVPKGTICTPAAASPSR